MMEGEGGGEGTWTQGGGLAKRRSPLLSLAPERRPRVAFELYVVTVAAVHADAPKCTS